ASVPSGLHSLYPKSQWCAHYSKSKLLQHHIASFSIELLIASALCPSEFSEAGAVEFDAPSPSACSFDGFFQPSSAPLLATWRHWTDSPSVPSLVKYSAGYQLQLYLSISS
ncbi:hypothetical protein, partial [Paenibacillus sp. AR247]|uniref:hypothetical protein n=1 Tax=Paenibacillus sp. AR247 TaxID=1631599 RepID=UPI00215870A5